MTDTVRKPSKQKEIGGVPGFCPDRGHLVWGVGGIWCVGAANYQSPIEHSNSTCQHQPTNGYRPGDGF